MKKFLVDTNRYKIKLYYFEKKNWEYFSKYV